ncbi:MAG: M3 family oligoendopeptidase [Planctomycetota bacterium]|jgi:oligoendopeptidase F
MNPKTASMEIEHPVPALNFLPEDFVPTDFAVIEPWMSELEHRELESVEELQKWILDRSELESLISEEAVARMYASVCKTDDEALEKAHLDYQTVVLPATKPVDDRLDRKFLDCRFRKDLPAEVWEVFDRDTELGVRLFREENVPLEAEEEKGSHRYQRILGAMTVEFRGETRTLSAMKMFLEDPDRATREEAFRLMAGRRLEDREPLDSLFEEMLENRQTQARNADFANYRDYMHESKGRFDYTPADCLAYQDNVEKYVMPLARKMANLRREQLQLAELRPWDMAVDPISRRNFEPFQDQAGQVDVASRMMSEVHPSFGAELVWMHEQGLLDLETRPHKAPGGFMDNLERRRVPVIFANSGTTHGDVETLVHEGGHALNGILCRDLEPMPYRMPPIEFAEVASMGMETMCMEHYDTAYPPEEVSSCRIKALEGIVHTFPWVAAIDGFQQWIYTHEGHDRAEREAAWLDLHRRFSAGSSWEGLETVRASLWQNQLHIFEVPFYYIEYALAQMGACQLWVRYRKDRKQTVERYMDGLKLGGSRKLPELFTAAGLEFDPRGDRLGDLMTEIEDAWHAEISKKA